MDFITVFVLSVALSMDCFAVSLTKGICIHKFKWKYAFRMAVLFGFFQAMMPVISYTAGSVFADQLKSIDHWISFVLLVLIGVKMIVEGMKPEEEEKQSQVKKPFKFKVLIPLAVATSIDALATGVIFIPYPEVFWKAILQIGIVSMLASLTGIWIGYRIKHRMKFNMEVIGGVVLIGIGIKILAEHIFKV